MRSLRYSVSASAIAWGIAFSGGQAFAADASLPQPSDSYVTIFGGWNWAREQDRYFASQYDVKLKDGFTVGAAYGRNVGNGFRWETEVALARNAHSGYRINNGPYDPNITDEIYSVFVLSNIWKDFALTDTVRPYVGAGLGTAFTGTEAGGGVSWKGSSTALAGQMGAGVRVSLTDKLALDASYRLRMAIDGTASRDGDYPSSFSYYSQSAQLGLTYALGEGQVMPAASDGASDWYASLFSGATLNHSDFNYTGGSLYSIDHKTGFTVGGALGTHLAPGLRAELELSYLRSALDNYSNGAGGTASGELDQLYVLANLWRDINIGGPITPYIGGGVGLGFAAYDDGDIGGNALTGDTGIGLAGQVGVGARVALSDNLSVDVGYRFKSMFDALLIGGNDLTDNSELAVTNHVFQVGVNYGLGSAGDAAPIASQNHYVTLFGGGVNALDTYRDISDHDYVIKFKTGFTVGAALGSNITENLRGELEASIQKYDVDSSESITRPNDASGKVTGYFVMGNIWRDMELGPFKPYAGGGVGLGLMDVHADWLGGGQYIADGTTLALALQLGSGVRYDLTDNLMLDVGYRFRAVNSVSTKEITGPYHDSSTFYTQSVQAGLTWNF